MPMNPDEITRYLHDAFPDAKIDLIDLAGDNDHFQVIVTSEVFRGMNRVQQHRMVFDALQGKMGGELHALAVKTALPKE